MNKLPALEGLFVCFLKMKKEANNDNNQISQDLWNLACAKWKFKSLWFFPGAVVLKMSCTLFKLILVYILSWRMNILAMFLFCIGMMYMKSIFFKNEIVLFLVMCVHGHWAKVQNQINYFVKNTSAKRLKNILWETRWNFFVYDFEDWGILKTTST